MSDLTTPGQGPEDQRVRFARETLAYYDRGQWADANAMAIVGHLGGTLRTLLEVLDETGPPGVTAVLPDGSATLSPLGLLTVLGALDDAARCGDEHRLLGGPEKATVVSYRALSRSLGDDR
jgi:hypothetical protein